MYVELALAGTAALIEERDVVQQLWRKLTRRWRQRQMQVVIFGAGGAGKSTLGAFLEGSLTVGPKTRSYQESPGREDYRREVHGGDTRLSIVVPPGQEPRREFYWRDQLQSLAGGKTIGVINVVSWGLNALQSESFTLAPGYRQGANGAEFLTDWQTLQRQAEIEIITDLVPHLEVAQQNIWMVTFVAKQDLWWDDRDRVRRHYVDGEYDKLITRITGTRGTKNFRHEYISASLVMGNFVTAAGEMVSPQ